MCILQGNILLMHFVSTHTAHNMVRTSKVHSHSETPAPELMSSRKVPTDDQRRLMKLLIGFCVGHLIVSAITVASLGVYVSEHVRLSLKINCAH